MKSQDFGTLLRAFSGVLEAADALRAREQIEALAGLFEASPSSTVAVVVKRLRSLPVPRPSDHQNLGDAARLLSQLRKLFGVAAKAGVIKDIEAVESLLRDRASADLRGFVRLAAEAGAAASKGRSKAVPVRDDLVAEYFDRLEASLGDQDRFLGAFDELRSNSAVGKAESVALAKRFTGASTPSKAAALKKIWSRHQAVLVSQAKARATSGRTAA